MFGGGTTATEALVSEQTPETWTILKLLRWSQTFLQQKGIESPRLDAEVMIAHLLNLRRIDLYARFDQPLTKPELDKYRAMVRDRVARKPVAYIIGHREFWALDLVVNEHVLIPRPDTELLVERAREVLRQRQQAQPGEPVRVLDLGTGSGAIALALAKELPEARVWASDLSPQALEVARENARRLGFAERVSFLEGDLFEPVKAAGLGPFDVVVSNPPYIPEGDIAGLMPEVGRHEPLLALTPGPSGLEVLRRLAAEAGAWLRDGGSVVCEIAYNQGPSAAEVFSGAGWAEVKIVKDPLTRQDRAVHAVKA
jgi:release factor glutamine methyltransferase